MTSEKTRLAAMLNDLEAKRAATDIGTLSIVHRHLGWCNLIDGNGWTFGEGWGEEVAEYIAAANNNMPELLRLARKGMKASDD